MQGPKRLSSYSPPRNKLLDREVYAQAGTAVSFTVRAYRGKPFECRELCERTVELLGEMRLEYDCWVSSYCLMPDHFHFVAGPNRDGASVLTYVERFKGKSTRESWAFGWRGKLWQPRAHDHVVRNSEALAEIHEYIWMNPVRAGLVTEASDWPWSGSFDEAL